MRRMKRGAVSAMAMSLMLAAGPLQADGPAELPRPDQIHRLYLKEARGWAALPDRVLQAFVAAEDRAFFDRPLARSVLTVQVAGWFAPQVQPHAENGAGLRLCQRVEP